jgi:ubiquinone/menaquinone biosynthesis C-methylase UbiE
MKLGDFSTLAMAYSESRPSYSNSVVASLQGLVQKNSKLLTIADIGAGTGIWTRQLADGTDSRIYAIEPNTEMFEQGIKDSQDTRLEWLQGGAENIPLSDSSVDWVTMASSFHWTNFEKAMEEFNRILKPGSYFTAIWNPRYYENNPKLVRVEEWLAKNISEKRVSSGRSGITNQLTELLEKNSFVSEVVYMEGKHTENMSVTRYVRAWESVNDIQVKLGTDGFRDFIKFINELFIDDQFIETTYLTRAWTAKFIG